MLILGDEISLKTNLLASLRGHWLLRMSFLLTMLLDYLSTLYFMVFDGVDTEANGVVRWLVYEFGMITAVFLGKSLQLVAALGFVALTQSLA